MSDIYDATKHTNGSDAEPAENTQEAGEAKVSWVDAAPKWEEPPAEETQEEREVTEKPKPKKKGKPKGFKVAKKAAKTSKVSSPKKPKKRAKEPTIQLDDFGFRKGSIRSKAATLYSRPNGATLSEVKSKLGSVQYNALKALRVKGFKVTSKEEDGKANRPATRFFLHAKKR